MPIDLVWMGDAPKLVEYVPGARDPWLPGMAFWAPYEMYLSEYYEQRVRAVRRPIAVMVPMRGSLERSGYLRGTVFIIDSHPTNNPSGAWTVTVDLASLVVGAKPRITVLPSIDCRGIYHGFLTDGVLTDDLG